ncbi:hypothetical protein BOSEA1005_30189 [Hyphomicrobiales bacterium]|nr:hypothetical protein BOSEA1005_30189 [Hyphomicrobiales bacterium]CAI0346519.1 hypothetical protein BO1005MUT1_520031 [Hyphomicrobiales bacterium]
MDLNRKFASLFSRLSFRLCQTDVAQAPPLSAKTGGEHNFIDGPVMPCRQREAGVHPVENQH